MTLQQVLINGQWRSATKAGEFQPYAPASGQQLETTYPISAWRDCESMLNAAAQAFSQLQSIKNQKRAEFLNQFADLIEANRASLTEMAHLETGLPVTPRLDQVELPRTTGQLRLAAKAILDDSWAEPIIDSENNIRSIRQGLGPVAVFGPNNFPFAFGSVSGGDFAAAIAAGNPVIAKAHPAHPGTSQLLAELALQALQACDLPLATLQMVYAISNEDGLKLVADPRLGASAFTGSRNAGLSLKAAADKAGKPIYLELSSLNPVVVLDGAMAERGGEIGEAFSQSCLMAAGQFCTKPGLLIIPQNEQAEDFIEQVRQQFADGPVGTLLSKDGADNLHHISSDLVAAGATLLTQSQVPDKNRFCQANTLLSVSGDSFISESETFQREMFGNASMIVLSRSTEQTVAILNSLEGNLTGCIYSHSETEDDEAYAQVEPVLREKVGRILNDKMPTGVAVSPAMNHGGPFPASGHPGFSAVGMPGSIKRFSALKCFDNVRDDRLPARLRNKNPSPAGWRFIDGDWTQADVE